MAEQLSFIPPTKIYFPEEDISAIQYGIANILRSGKLTLGEYTKALETEFSSYIGITHAVAVNSGTSALEIVLRTLNLNGASVVVPTNTFFATAAAVVHAGATPIFADCDRTLSMDVESLKSVIREDTRAVVLVHIGGFVTPRIQEIVDFCKSRNIYLIEDAAHAHGSSFNEQKAGTFGEAATFSFYPTKVMTSAEGGIIVTNNEEIARLARAYRDQGKTNFTSNIHDVMGSNWRLSEPNALIGYTQCKRLTQFIDARRAIAHLYDEGLKNISGIEILKEADGVFCNYYKYVVHITDTSKNRTELKKLFKEDYQIGLAGEVYELPLHLQPVFKPYAENISLPQSEKFCKEHICLPMSAVQTEEETQRIITAIKTVFSANTPPTSPLTVHNAIQTSLPHTKKMKVAVIGGSGFIGSHIVDTLIAENHEVVIYDLMRPQRQDVPFITLDVLNPSMVNTVLTGGFDAVYMLAAMANVNDVFNNPVEACDINIKATVNVLEAARKNKIDRVILSSTVWLYEMIDDVARLSPVNESVPFHTQKVNHVYTATKLAAEQYCIAYQKLYGQNYTILRYGIPYGPRARSGTVIANFVANALKGEPINIQGDGSQTRNFVYVGDLAHGNVHALQPKAANQTYNIEGLRPVSIREIAEIVQELIPGTTVNYTDARPGDFKGFSASYEKARRELGWEPTTDIREGIKQYVEWVKTTTNK